METVGITLDKDQKEFIHRVGLRKENVGNRAVAGHGKSLTLIESVKMLREKGLRHSDILCLTFMRTNKKHLQDRIGQEAHIKSISGVAYVAVWKWLKGYKDKADPHMPDMEEWGQKARDDNKIERLVEDFAMEYWGLSGHAFTQEQWQIIEDMKVIPSMCMNTLTHPHNWDAIVEMCDTYGLLLPMDENFAALCVQYVFEEGQKKERLKRQWCYEELHYLAATSPDIRIWPYQAVFVDEVQDMNRAHQVILSRCVKDKLYFAGDPQQNIFTFNGADIEGFNTLCQRPNTYVVESNTTYRCSHAVTQFAQQYVPRITAWDDALPGAVHHIREVELLKNLCPGDMFLSKTNLGAISVALRCLEAGKSSYVRGRSIAADMVGLLITLEKDKGYYFQETPAAIERWRRQQVAIQYAKYGDNVAPEKIRYLCDRSASLERLWDGAMQEGVDDAFLFRRYIDTIIPEVEPKREDSVTASTIHKAKGDENPAVFISESDLKTRACKSAPLTQADKNATYVGVTRALDVLFLVEEERLAA